MGEDVGGTDGAGAGDLGALGDGAAGLAGGGAVPSGRSLAGTFDPNKALERFSIVGRRRGSACSANRIRARS